MGIFEAVKSGTAESLLKNGADATIKDENNTTALDYFLRNEKFQPDDKKK